MVADIRKSEILGNVVIVKCPKGDFWGYCHLASVKVKKGDKVTIDTTIGIMGATGSAAVGKHLHLTCGSTLESVFTGKVIDAVGRLEKRIEQEKKAA